LNRKSDLKNKVYTVKIDGVGSDGQGVGRLNDGFAVFVPNALPGETVSALIIKVKSNYCVGKLLEVVVPSDSRVKPDCPVALRCGGCSLLHCAYPFQLDLKQQIVEQAFGRIGKFADPPIARIIAGQPFRYRNKSIFPVSESDGLPQIGFYSKRSHTVVSVEDCLIEPEINSRVIKLIGGYIADSGISIYNENSHSGLLRHVLLRVGFATGEVMVCLVINGDGIPKPSLLIEQFINDIPGFSTMAINKNKSRTNVVLGDQTTTLYGSGVIHDYIGDLRFEISPVTFFQVNATQTKVLYDIVLEFASLTGAEVVIDAFCGIGTISLFLARFAKHVYGVEIVSESVLSAKRNAEANSIHNVTFYNEPAESWLPAFSQNIKSNPDIIVLDPPRKGCDVELLQAIGSLSLRKVIYVSCDMGTLARDTRRLADMGYVLMAVQPVDMFPQTSHVEAVVLLEHLGM